MERGSLRECTSRTCMLFLSPLLFSISLKHIQKTVTGLLAAEEDILLCLAAGNLP